MYTLNQDIEDRTFKFVHLPFGEEVFLEKSYKNHLRGVLTGGGTMNYNHFEGKGMNVNKIIGLVDIMPSSVEKRLVLMENSGFFKSGAEADELTEYMGGIPESTYLMFVESEVDKRGRLCRVVGKYGCAAKPSHQEPAQFARWTAGTLFKNGRKIIGRTMEFFLSKAGDDMENISSELEKLISYILGREATTDGDVETICTTQVANKIFDMITVVVVRQTRKAMDLYKDLLMLKEPLMYILFLIARWSNQILQVRDLMGKGMDKSTIVPRLKFQPFVAGEIMLQTKTFIREQILSYVDLYVDAKEGAKTGKLQDRLAVEPFIVNKYEQK